MKRLVTGGAGFIGSHTLVELSAAGHETVVIDNLSNSNPKSLERVAELTGKKIPFYEVDIRDREGLNRVMEAHHFDACIHFAGCHAPARLQEHHLLVVGYCIRRPSHHSHYRGMSQGSLHQPLRPDQEHA